MMCLVTIAMMTATQSLGSTALPPLPDAEGFAGMYAGTSHGSLVTAGGANFPDKKPWEGGKKVWYDTVYALDRPGGEWRVAGRLPRPLGYGVSVSFRDRVVCVGGSDADRHYADAFTVEVVKGKFSVKNLPPLPVTMANGCGALVGDLLYVAGGQEKPDSTSALSRVYVLGLGDQTPAWKEVPGFPGEGRILAAAASHDGSFWVFGGASLHPDAKGQPVRTYLRNAYRYDPQHGWRRVADLPRPAVAAPSPAPTSPRGIFILGGDDGSQVGVPPGQHKGFAKDVQLLATPYSGWVSAGSLTAPRVTAPSVSWAGGWVVVNGEMRPGVRSPEVRMYTVP